MKKMGLIMGIAAVLTVGGVYATWNYAGNNVNSQEKSISVGIAEAGSTEAVGTLTATGDIKFMIDQAAADDYHGKLVKTTDSANEIAMSFAAKTNAPNEWKDGVTFTYTISIVAGAYESKPILVLDSTKASASSAANQTSWTLSAETILDAVSVNQDFTLGNIDAYNAFSTALASSKPSIKVTVSVAA